MHRLTHRKVVVLNARMKKCPHIINNNTGKKKKKKIYVWVCGWMWACARARLCVVSCVCLKCLLDKKVSKRHIFVVGVEPAF